MGETGGGGGLIGTIAGLLDNLIFGGGNVQPEITNLREAVRTTWLNLVDVGAFLGAELSSAVGSLRGIVGAIQGALTWIITSALAHLHDLIAEIVKLLHHLKAIAAALTKYLQQLQKQYNALVGAQMRKWLDLIQRIRRILVPFRLLHIGIAAKLDTTLARLEGSIGAKWAGLIAKQNEVIGILNDVLDPRQLLRPGHALGAAGMAIGAIHDAIAAADLRSLFCLPTETVPLPFIEPYSTYIAGTLAEVRGHSGDQARLEAQRDQALRSSAIELGQQGPA